jgi:hypothetical protein
MRELFHSSEGLFIIIIAKVWILDFNFWAASSLRAGVSWVKQIIV